MLIRCCPWQTCRHKGSRSVRAVRGSPDCQANPAGVRSPIAAMTQDDQGKDQQVKHRHLDVIGLYLLAEVFRCSPNHQAGDEYGNNDEHKHAVHARADTAENDFPEQDVR